MKRTIYIVKTYEYNDPDSPKWSAYKRGILSTFNRFTIMNKIINTSSYIDADDCEQRIRNLFGPHKPQIVRVLQIG